MEAKATLSNYRQAPRKVRLLANLIVGKKTDDVILELNYRAKRAAPVFMKLIKSAIANAKNAGLDEHSLVVKKVTVDKGVVLKRSMPRAHGRAFPIHKHTSHIMIVLSDTSAQEKRKEVKKKNEGGEKRKLTAEKPKTEKKKMTAKTITKKKVSGKAK